MVDGAVVERRLVGLAGVAGLTSLFVDTLGYDEENARLDTGDWPEEVTGRVRTAPTIVASGGRGGRFVVIHTGVERSGEVPIGLQRRIVERINPKSHERYPNALFVFSDATYTL